MNFFRIILWPFNPVYKFALTVRNTLFDKKTFKIGKVNIPVISVGNITVGGAGKTPLTIYILELLKKAGWKPGVLSRGYGRKSKGFVFVSDGMEFKTDVEHAGDEIYLTALECEVPAAVCEKRTEGAGKLIELTDIDSLVLDDAFQHRWIARDLDIIIFDQRFLSKTGGIEQQLLPTGNMREPFTSVKRAHAIIINRKFSDYTGIPIPLLPYFENKLIFNSFYKAAGFCDVKSREFYPAEDFRGQKGLVVVGIANPYSFLNVLEKNDIDVSNKLIFRDHKNYTIKEIEKIRKEFYSTNSHSVITTAKDAVKLMRFAKELDDIDIYFLRIEIVFDEQKRFDEFIINKIRSSLSATDNKTEVN